MFMVYIYIYHKSHLRGTRGRPKYLLWECIQPYTLSLMISLKGGTRLMFRTGVHISVEEFAGGLCTIKTVMPDRLTSPPDGA